MPRTKLISATTSVVMIASTASLAHETDVHHWFEHQRAQSDGGDLLLPQSTVVIPLRTEARSLAGARDAEIGQAPSDCLIEEMKRTENYVPSSACAYRRPLVDEGREEKRNRMR